jgi:endonuclease-3
LKGEHPEVMDLERASQIIRALSTEYPKTKTALRYGNPWELLIATMLSAQTTDSTVNKVTETLFKRYKTVRDIANASQETLEKEIRSTGFYHRKAKYLKAIAEAVITKFNGEVPRTMSELISLPGVARKTANIVLWNAYGVIEGVAVDTHVQRLAQRMGLTQMKDPDKIERDLMMLTPREQWPELTNLLIAHGRRVCVARKPKCSICIVNRLCPSAFSYNQ